MMRGKVRFRQDQRSIRKVEPLRILVLGEDGFRAI
jgi:hypothetical protein